MKEELDKHVLSVTGQVDIFEDMPGTNADAISILTNDGDEYVVITHKMIKRLMPFAGEEVDILFQGTVSRDHSGLEIFNIHSFKVLSEEALELAKKAEAKEATVPRNRKSHDLNDDDIQGAEGLDQVVSGDWIGSHDADDENDPDLDDDLDDQENLDDEDDLDDQEDDENDAPLARRNPSL